MGISVGSLALTSLLLAACTDVFQVPLPPDQGVDLSGGEGDSGADLTGSAGDDAFGMGGDGGTTLPASCALLPCSPAMNEGDVDLSSGSVSGCHAYNTLTITQTVRATRTGTMGFLACANTIVIGGLLNANGEGEDPGSGPGAGGSCGTGGGHGGAGANVGGCGGGGTYGDMMRPRELGSGGGGTGSSGGKGGGAIELAADSINIIGFITANGQDGTLAVNQGSGGGAGGSILLQANTFLGAGNVRASGGGGVGISGGGGGGGRVAIYSSSSTSSISVNVGGGDSMNSSMKGAAGTEYRVP